MGKPGGRKKKNAGVGVDFKKVKHKVRLGSQVPSWRSAFGRSGVRRSVACPTQSCLIVSGGQEAAAGAEPDGHQLQVADHLPGAAALPILFFGALFLLAAAGSASPALVPCLVSAHPMLPPSIIARPRFVACASHRRKHRIRQGVHFCWSPLSQAQQSVAVDREGQAVSTRNLTLKASAAWL